MIAEGAEAKAAIKRSNFLTPFPPGYFRFLCESPSGFDQGQGVHLNLETNMCGCKRRGQGSMNTDRKGYSTLQITLHWVIAALVLFQLVFGESMSHLVNAIERSTAAAAGDQILGLAHYWVGLAILALVALRLAIRLVSGTPDAVSSGPAWMERAARLSHWLFYVLLIVVPITGLLGYYLGEWFADIHSVAKPIFIVLIVIHAAAALFHQFWLGDGTLRRMLVPS